MRLETQVELGQVEQRNPLVQSLWMFVSDLFAAAVPVIPFAFLALGPARTVSVVITGLLLVLLGAGRAAAGLLIGKLVTR